MNDQECVSRTIDDVTRKIESLEKDLAEAKMVRDVLSRLLLAPAISAPAVPRKSVPPGDRQPLKVKKPTSPAKGKPARMSREARRLAMAQHIRANGPKKTSEIEVELHWPINSVSYVVAGCKLFESEPDGYHLTAEGQRLADGEEDRDD